MANVTTLAAGGTVGASAGNNVSPNRWTHEIDIADAVDAGVTTGGYVNIIDLPADTYFTLEQVEIVTTLDLDSGASDRVDVGDTDDDEFVSNATTLTAGTNLTLLKVNGTPGNVYTSADSVRLKLTGDKLAGGTADATGVIRFVGTIMSTARNTPASVGTF